MHPLVRDLYKRALVVGRDYPLGLEYVRRTWKKALRNPENCPACYQNVVVGAEDGTAIPVLPPYNREQERQLHKAVGRGRFMVREMIGVIQLKKYRSMKQRYGQKDGDEAAAAATAALLSQLNRKDG